MGLRINTNIPSMQTTRELARSTEQQKRSFERLSSGRRISSASEDSATLAIGDHQTAQIRSMAQAERNANDSISLVQTAEGGMNEIGNMVIRLRELAIQAATDTVGDRERAIINQETQSIIGEIDRVANVTQFNDLPLLNGTAKRSELEFHVGVNNTDSDKIKFNLDDYDVQTSKLGVDGISAATIDEARDSIERIDESLHRLNGSRARLGAMQNKLQVTTSNLSLTRQNLSEARSRGLDVDVAEESANLMKQNILQQAGTAVLGQANQSPALALKLL